MFLVAVQQGGAETPAERFFDWKQKIRKEKTLIFNVKKALKLENVYVKQVCVDVVACLSVWSFRRWLHTHSILDSFCHLSLILIFTLHGVVVPLLYHTSAALAVVTGPR